MSGKNKRKITIAGSEHEVLLVEHRDDHFILIEYDGVPYELFLGGRENRGRSALLEGTAFTISEVTKSRGSYTASVNDLRIQVLFPEAAPYEVLSLTRPETAVPKPHLSVRKGGRVIAHMPGRIVSVNVRLGDSVKVGDPILVLLAMKMENTIIAPSSGIVSELHVDTGVTVNKGDLLAVID